MIDLDLLRQAWPDGYLGMRGVQTHTGFLFTSNCVVFAEHGVSEIGVARLTYRIIHHVSERHKDIQEWIDAGSLLPNVERRDVPTWACLKADVARALQWKVPDDLTWSQGHDHESWVLTAWLAPESGKGGVRHEHVFADIKTDDPAEALVLARIQTRKEGTNVG